MCYLNRILFETRFQLCYPKRMWKYFCAVFIISSLSFIETAFAHRDDFIDETLVYLTLEKGEIEPEYSYDYGRKDDPNLEGRISFSRHNFALEYGITEKWMLDSRITMEDVEHKSPEFESARFETRFRFYEEGERPIDMALSAEVNTERNEDDDLVFGIEPRLIFSRDFNRLNLTLNLPLEIKVDSNDPAFIPSFGLRYHTPHIIRMGIESRYNLDNHESSIFPQIWFAFSYDVTIKLGYSLGLGRDEEDFVRIAFEVGF